jgi:hypothetical protein
VAEPASLARPRVGEGTFAIGQAERVHLPVVALDRGERGLRHLEGRQLTAAVVREQLRRRLGPELGHAAVYPPSTGIDAPVM